MIGQARGLAQALRADCVHVARLVSNVIGFIIPPRPCTCEAFASARKKFEKATSFGAHECCALQLSSGNVLRISHTQVERPESALELAEGPSLQAAPTQSHEIQSDERVALGCHAKRGHVERNASTATDHCALADAAKLMYDGPAAEKGPFPDLYVPTQQDGIGYHDVIADTAIVSNMAPGHQKAVGPNFRRGARLGRAIDGDMLAQDGSCAHPHAGFDRGVETQVLRWSADRRERMDHDTVFEDAVAADVCVRVDDAACTQPCTSLDDGRWMNPVRRGLDIGHDANSTTMQQTIGRRVATIPSQNAATHPVYRPDIDGLRAIAVAVVVVFHAFPGVLPGGFIGVDVFFVISGFLISTIVFSNLEQSRFRLLDFYRRRIRRIFPALIIVLFASLLFGWYALLPDEYSRLGKHAAAGAAFVSNFVYLKESGYFDTAAASKPMLHLWSLAIEEQFYLFWPLMVAYVWKRGFNFLTLTALVAAVSFATNIYLAGGNPVAAFYSPLARFWELMIGGALAYAALHAPQLVRRHRNLQSVFGFGLLATGLVCIDAGRAYPGWWALLPTLGGVLIISAGSQSWLNRTVLSHKLLVGLGLISYPLYLWHWPLLSFARIALGAEPSLPLRIGLVSAALLLSVATYRWVERPFRSRGNIGGKAMLAAAAMCAVCAVALIAYGAILQPRNSYPALRAEFNVGDFEYLTNLNQGDAKRSGIYTIHSALPDTTLFIGDSHVAQYAPRVGELIAQSPARFNTAIFVVDGGCPPLPDVFEDARVHDKCRAIRDKGFRLLEQDSVKAVVFGAAWSGYFVDQAKSPKNSPSDYDYYYSGGGRRAYFRGGNGAQLALARFATFLAELAKAKKVYLLLDNPVGESFDPHNFFDRHLGMAAPMESRRVTLAGAEQLAVRQELIAVAKRAGVELIDPWDTLCRERMCDRLSADQEAVYKDANHLNSTWIKSHAGYIDRALLAR